MGYIILALVLTAAAFIGLNLKKASYGNKYEFRFVRRSLLSLVLLSVGFFGFLSKIDANMVGIVYDPFAGGVQDETLSEGFHIITPFNQITKVTTKNRTRLVETAGQTQDAIYATFQMTIIYKIETVNAGRFFRVTSMPDIPDAEFQSMVKEALQRNAVQFDIYEILGENLDVLRTQIEVDLKEIFLERYFITIVSLSFDDIDAGTQIEEIIKNKAQAIQQIEIADKEREKAEIDAATLLIQAQATADAIVIAKEAEAAGITLIADVQAQAINVKLAQVMLSLGLDPAVTPLTDTQLKIVAQYMAYLEYLVIWDGSLPNVVTDGTTSFFLTIE